MSTVLVAGVNGFVGRHLAKELHKRGHDVIGTGMEAAPAVELQSVVKTYSGNCDLTDSAAVKKLPLADIDAAINLAGLAQTGASFADAERYQHINVAVHTTLVELLQTIKPDVRVVAVSSGAVYDGAQPMPLTEQASLINVGSPYALSKIAMEHALQPYQANSMDIIIARPFNHIGPGQMGGFIVPDLTRQVLQGGRVMVGNLATERDYTDVRDVVRAYVLLATETTLRHHTYNICSGNSVSGQLLLDLIIQHADKTNVKVIEDSSKLRPDDPKQIVGSNKRLHDDTGWQPTIPLHTTIRDYVAFAKQTF